mmetsp:Transcript_6851/g.15180  ORF Transcript_6851/g.15180 Transcript_6851/m.15180 type:complete len:220 (-) Transcript_6851:763-1422(-)
MLSRGDLNIGRKYILGIFFRNSYSGICDFDGHELGHGSRFGENRDGAAGGGELDGVGDQVPKNLFDPNDVDEDKLVDKSLVLDHKPVSFGFAFLFVICRGVLAEFRQINECRIQDQHAFIHFVQRQTVVQDLGCRGKALPHHLHNASRLFVEHGVLIQNLDCAGHCPQRISHLVANVTQEHVNLMTSRVKCLCLLLQLPGRRQKLDSPKLCLHASDKEV